MRLQAEEHLGRRTFMKDMAKLGITLMIVCAVAGLGPRLSTPRPGTVIEQRAQDLA